MFQWAETSSRARPGVRNFKMAAMKTRKEIVKAIKTSIPVM